MDTTLNASTRIEERSSWLKAETPLFSRELLRPLRLLSLAAGIALLIAGSIYLPSTDWDIPICFIMGISAYVLAPWVFRQVFNFRWKWLLSATVALWFAIDGTYSAYWCLRGFDALAAFRPANYFYCIWLFWACGFVWNIDYLKIVWSRKSADSAETGVHSAALGRNSLARFLGALILAAALSLLVAGIIGVMNHRPRENAGYRGMVQKFPTLHDSVEMLY